MTFQIFHSSRLIYRPIEENPKWDNTLYELRSSNTFWNGDIALPTPGGQSTAREYREILTKHVSLALYICIVNEDANPIQSDTKKANGPGNVSDDDLTAIGTLTFSKNGPENHAHHSVASLGIEILPAYMGKGYGSEALKWMQWYAFCIARLHRLEIQCVDWNKGALRVYERLGWKVEGVAREAVWFMGGWHGLVSMGLLEQEWRAREGEGKRRGTEEIARLMGCE